MFLMFYAQNFLTLILAMSSGEGPLVTVVTGIGSPGMNLHVKMMYMYMCNGR